MSITGRMADFAAEWWAKRIDGNVKHDNGDESLNGAVAGVLGDMLSKPTTQEQLEVFKEHLSRYILDKASLEKSVYLECDYNPDGPLTTSATKAGISLFNFPWKTSMMITEDGIEVKEGYGAHFKKIYHEKYIGCDYLYIEKEEEKEE